MKDTSLLSPIVFSQKLQEEAAALGFDWPDIFSVIANLKEEVIEFEQACTENNPNAVIEELGDVLFVCANLARHFNQNADKVIEKANQKFQYRIEHMNNSVKKAQKKWQDYSLDELNALWQKAKEPPSCPDEAF